MPTPRWLFWARGTLLCALAGHWIGNLLFDAAEYEQAGVAFTWRALAPIALQTVVILLIVAVLGPIARRTPTPRPSRRRARPSGLLLALITSQLALFLLLEVSERVVQREPFADGLLASGFVFELAFAIGGALLLAALGMAVIRAIRSSTRRPGLTSIHDLVHELPTAFPVVHVARTAGGVRAPPRTI